MSRESPKSPEEIKKLISKSGYLDEQKVVVEFEKVDFFAGANYAFEDQDEGKSREIDFIATKYTDYKFGKTGFYFYVYGEVKKKTNPLVFFERKRQKRELEELGVFIPIVASQEFFSFLDPRLDIKKILKFSQLHHQTSHDFISTQFCEIDKNKAAHKDLYNSLFLPLLKCVDSEISSVRKSTPDFRSDDPMYFFHLFHPILVVCGPLYSYNVNDDCLTEKNYIVYRRHHASKNVTRTLLIDVVAAQHLPDYISSKLLQTYQLMDSSLKERMAQIIDYCHKDRELMNQLIQLQR